mmetsp:Transcript_3016/g.4733  ORF Transcript_3016/g.4733 Transcript_3016/m.4733 type:complete len:331 (-) Transcript_3016:109-1101(-)
MGMGKEWIEQKDSKESCIKLSKELFTGGLANAVPSTLLNWSDVCKVRLQTQPPQNKMYTSLMHCISRVLAEEGFYCSGGRGGLLFPGIFPSISREFGYSSFRLGLYPYAKSFWGGKQGTDLQHLGICAKLAAGLTTGALGSALANPMDLIKIRMQAEAGKVDKNGFYSTGLHEGRQPTYRHTRHALGVIIKQEGIGGLYTGASTTILRAGFLAAGQLATYDHSKNGFKDAGLIKEGPVLHVVCSILSAVSATIFSQPFDTIKSRFMSDTTKVWGGMYRSPLHCVTLTLKHEGPAGFYKGTGATFARLCPHFILALPLWEQLRLLFGLGYF